MDGLIAMGERLLSSQPILQVFVGGIVMLLIAFMVLRAKGDRESLPAPASLTIADVPAPFLHGPREIVDMMREKGDYLRRIAEDSGRIAECVRITREDVKKQTEILEDMREDQRVETRVAAERHRGDH